MVTKQGGTLNSKQLVSHMANPKAENAAIGEETGPLPNRNDELPASYTFVWEKMAKATPFTIYTQVCTKLLKFLGVSCKLILLLL